MFSDVFRKNEVGAGMFDCCQAPPPRTGGGRVPLCLPELNTPCPNTLWEMIYGD
jgi:hypothetical protein